MLVNEDVFLVCHRLDDLENKKNSQKLQQQVCHRLDDLESKTYS